MNSSTPIEMIVTPAVGLVDDPLQIVLRGLTPNTAVTVSARHLDARGGLWSSHGTYVADGAGFVDLAQAPPLCGTYCGADGEGLIRSLVIDDDADRRPFDGIILDPIEIEFTAKVLGRRCIGTASTKRFYVATNVKSREVHEHGLHGLLFTPRGCEVRPGVIVVGGSGGGLRFSAQVAALLASHGFAGLALAYFGLPNLPSHLVEIPLEYFAKASAWLIRQDCVEAGGIGVMGISRGAELALLLGSRLPMICAVVEYCPSHTLWSGLGQDHPVDKSAWTELGRALPFARLIAPHLQSVSRHVFRKAPIALTPLFNAALDSSIPADAAIPVERTNGPILLVSGEDDQMWPSSRMGELVMRRLADSHHRHASRHCRYADAGHLIRPPGVSTATLAGKFAFGGEGAAQAAANRAAWTETLAFLASSLAGREKLDTVSSIGG